MNRLFRLALFYCLVSFMAWPPPARTQVAPPSEKARNPHYQVGQCGACHPDGKPPGLTHKNMDDLCIECHSGEKRRIEVHPTGIKARQGVVQRVPPEFPLLQDKLSCATCHDVRHQCSEDPTERERNPLFLRGGPYKDPWLICFRCHESDLYEIFNPHDQLDEKSETREDTCQYCHEPADPSKKEEVPVGPPFVDICRSCHRVTAHPAGKNHLRRPPPKMMSFLQRNVRQNKLYLPLNARDEVYCSTCHNPHEKGVVQEDDIKSQGAEGDHSKEYRVRARPPDLCLTCHDLGFYRGRPGFPR